MTSYIHFTDEQKQKANSVDLVDFLTKQSEKLIRSGKEWRWLRHDSVTIRGNQWFRHSSKQGSCAIDFVQEFYNLSFPEAVTLLLGGEQGAEFKQSKNDFLPKRKSFALPAANSDMRRVYAYLLKQRYIDRDIITYFVREKKIFEDKDYHNAVFVGFDELGIAKHAHKKGTNSGGKSYRGNVEGSDPKYSFSHIGTGDTLCVFEAPIDMLSYINLHKNNWEQYSYVALCGVAEHAMLHLLLQNKQIHNITLCLDHDAAGIEAACRLTEMLRDNGYNSISQLLSINKDWNEDIKAQNGIQVIPAEENPQIEACEELCSRLYELCIGNKKESFSYEDIAKHYDCFKAIVQNEKLLSQNSVDFIMDHLQNMTAFALCFAQKELRQIEQPAQPEQLIEFIKNKFAPHKNRSTLKNVTDDINYNLLSIKKQFADVGIRTLADKQNLTLDCISLAENCIKAHILTELNWEKQLENELEQRMNFKMTM